MNQCGVNLYYGTSFHLAAQLGHSAVLMFLIEEIGSYCRQKGDDEISIKKYIFKVLNATDRHMRTPLECAVNKSQLETIEILLNFGAEINENDYDYQGDGGVVLRSAVKYCSADVVSLLLKRGADTNIEGRRDGMSLHWAIERAEKEPEIAAEIIVLLLAYGADVFYSCCSSSQAFSARDRCFASYKNHCDSLGLSTNNADMNIYFKQNTDKFLAPYESYKAHGYDIYIYTEHTPISLAAIKDMHGLVNVMLSYKHTAQIVLKLLSYARIIGANNLSDTVLLPLELFSKILYLAIGGVEKKLRQEQVDSIFEYAFNKKTLGTSRESFLTNSVFSFFCENNIHEMGESGEISANDIRCYPPENELSDDSELSEGAREDLLWNERQDQLCFDF